MPNPTPPPDAAPAKAAPATHWLQAARVYLEPACLRMLLLGFSAGLPMLLVFNTLGFRLREAGIDRSTIGFISWVTLAYGFKWAWSPLVDHLAIPWLTRRLGQRRSWLLLSQCCIMLALLGMALLDPRQQLGALTLCAVAVAFASATQDIALDAYRIETGDAQRQAAMAATYQGGYRVALIWAGAGALWLAARGENAGQPSYQQAAWAFSYSVMAATMLVGVLATLLAPEPQRPLAAPTRDVRQWLAQAVAAPFADFIGRYGRQALLILALISVYRISDIVMGVMASTFYVDMQYTKDQIAAVTKIYGVVMTLLGAFAGGWVAMRIGVLRVLMLGALLSSATNLLFAWLAQQQGPHFIGLVLVVSADNLAAGLASSAFIAYLSSLTNVRYSATQYALFSSMMTLLPKWLGGFSGQFVDAHGYANFFTLTACLGLPVLLLIAWIARLDARAAPHQEQERDPAQQGSA